MREQERIKRILSLIEEYWNKYPDQRFGQLLINLKIASDDLRLWNNEDAGLEEHLKVNLEKEEWQPCYKNLLGNQEPNIRR